MGNPPQMRFVSGWLKVSLSVSDFNSHGRVSCIMCNNLLSVNSLPLDDCRHGDMLPTLQAEYEECQGA